MKHPNAIFQSHHDCLTFEELEQIEMLESTGFERVDLIKDMFLFLIVTTVRISSRFDAAYTLL